MKNFLFLLLTLFIGTTVFAQKNISINGVIKSTDNNFLPNVQVNLVDKNDFILDSIFTNELGQYGFDNVNAGIYTLQLIYENDTLPLFTNVKALGNKEVYQDFVIKTNKINASTRNGALVNTNIIASDKIERLASTNPVDALLLNSAYNAGRSKTAKGNDKIMIDGQIIDNANNINIIPGSISTVQK